MLSDGKACLSLLAMTKQQKMMCMHVSVGEGHLVLGTLISCFEFHIHVCHNQGDMKYHFSQVRIQGVQLNLNFSSLKNNFPIILNAHDLCIAWDTPTLKSTHYELDIRFKCE